MRTAGLTGQCTFSVRLVDDRLDGARAAAAFGAAAKGVIDLLGISWRVVGRVHGVANILVTEDIAGTDDHETRKRPSVMQRHRYGTRQGALEVPNKAEMTSGALPGKSALTF
jgi:hypothetical protein